MKTQWPTWRIILLSLVLGIAVAPAVLPLLASWGGSVGAQSLPFTPTPEPTERPSATVAPSATRTATIAPTSTALAPTATRNPDDPILGGTAEMQTPIIRPSDYVPDPSSGTDGGGSGSDGATTTAGTPTPTPKPGTVPDRCEPNDSLVQPCALPTEAETADLSFVDDSVDVFSVILKGGRTYTIRAESTDGIDPAITVYRAGETGTAVAQNDDLAAGSSAAQVQVTTESDAWYLVVVENKAPGDMHGRTYRFSARSANAVTPTPNAATTAQAGSVPVQATVGDLYENNYSPETAGTLVWGVPYDLSLVCPVQGQCVNGDHDFFWLPVKRGVPMVAVSYDLGPGADTAITLYQPKPNQIDPSIGPVGWAPVVANDDVVGGFTLRSQIFFTPDWDGYALLVIAASRRADPPPLPPALGPAGRYRLMVGPPALEAVRQVLDAQRDIPAAPTSAPTVAPPTSEPVAAPVQPTVVSDEREVIREESVTGVAVVIKNETVLYAAAPPTDGDALATYPEGAQVTLLGQTYAGWVKVQPMDSVSPGWMFGPNLRPLQVSGQASASTPVAGSGSGTGGSGTGTGTAQTGVPATGATSTTSTGGSHTSGAGATAEPVLNVLDPLPVPPSGSGAPVARTVRVTVCGVAAKAGETTCTKPLRGMRVDLVLAATQATLVQNVTDRDGSVTLSTSVRAGTMLLVRVPALGVQSELREQSTTLMIRVAGEE